MEELREEDVVEDVGGRDKDELATVVLKLVGDGHELRFDRQRALIGGETRNGIVSGVVLEGEVEVGGGRRSGVRFGGLG